jgi:hypothetical protein
MQTKRQSFPFLLNSGQSVDLKLIELAKEEQVYKNAMEADMRSIIKDKT